jgi:NlpC/P60 family putative phage cell wall peptidase
MRFRKNRNDVNHGHSLLFHFSRKVILMSPPLLTAARGWVGTPYQHQASLKHVGCDCLGLIRGVWRDVYGQEPFIIPPYSPDWAEACGKEAFALEAKRILKPVPLTALAPTDLLLFRWKENSPAKHCAILTENNTIIHAHDGACVAEVPFSPFWRKQLAYAFQFPPLPSP